MTRSSCRLSVTISCFPLRGYNDHPTPAAHIWCVFSANVHKHMQKCSPGLSRLKPRWIPGSFAHSCHLSGAYESRGSTSLTSLLVLSGWQVNVNLNRWLLPPHLQSPPFYSVCKLPIRKHKHTYVPPAPLRFKPAETRRLNNKNSQAMKNKRRSAKNWGKSGWRGSLDDKVQKGAFPAFSPPWVHHGRL